MEEGASPPRWALDKKLGEDASMKEKKEGEKERGGEHEIEGRKRERSWTLSCDSQDSHSSKLQQVLHMLLFID